MHEQKNDAIARLLDPFPKKMLGCHVYSLRKGRNLSPRQLAGAVSGDLILIKLKNASEPVFRQLIIDDDVRYSKALNPSWPVCVLNAEVESICVAMEAKLQRMRGSRG
ncbi:hypothetical protein SC206_05675 [Rouxiella sp. T17]|uniref:hypothetical protein n=1 Tax=Rouxiella sp. T17 TaxID=3085684 RepID=UPI002FCB00F8